MVCPCHCDRTHYMPKCQKSVPAAAHACSMGHRSVSPHGHVPARGYAATRWFHSTCCRDGRGELTIFLGLNVHKSGCRALHAFDRDLQKQTDFSKRPLLQSCMSCHNQQLSRSWPRTRAGQAAGHYAGARQKLKAQHVARHHTWVPDARQSSSPGTPLGFRMGVAASLNLSQLSHCSSDQ